MQGFALCVVAAVLSGQGAHAFRKRFQMNMSVGGAQSVGDTHCCCKLGQDCEKGVYTWDTNMCCLNIGHSCTSWRNMFGQFKSFPPAGDTSYCDASSRPTTTPAPPEQPRHCCCKETNCRDGATGDNQAADAVYNPNQNRCCKLKQHACGDWRQTFSGYKKTPPTPDYCNSAEPMDRDFVIAEFNDTTPPQNDTVEYPPGSVGHTLNEYCDFSKHVDHSETDQGVKREIIQQIVDELDGNNIDTMAKEMFSLYVCVRWTASPEFIAMAEDEMETEQLQRKSLFEHFEDQSFLPLKCTQNFKVFETQVQSETHFVRFEAEMQAQQAWYENEQNTALSKRLGEIYAARENKQRDRVEQLTGAFDLRAVRRAAETCTGGGQNVKVDTWKSTTEELFADCAAVRWWKHKLEDWHRAMPFSTFMLPGELADEAKPRADEQVMVCFGKRVASALHRRKDGDHLMTDQQTVGCHGFWDFPLAAKMLKRIIDLWRPPTCQLAAMELEFKVKILEMVSDMNERLFDALPSMLVEDMASVESWDGKPLQADNGVGLMQGIWKSIVDGFAGLRGKYDRLGKLLGGTVVKWSVCPMKEITNQTALDQLDSVLGTEDNVARWYARVAYAEHTGESMQLPGARCNGTFAGLPRAKTCELGLMREDMPEPYKDQHFLCPIRPLLPSKQQMDVFKNKEDHCMLRMNHEQSGRMNWFYKGHAPTMQQYNRTEMHPTENLQAVKVLESRSAPDEHFGIWRDFVTIAKGCTEREREMTPNFCDINVINDQGNENNLLTRENPITSSDAVSAQGLTRWLGQNFKGLEVWLRTVGSEWFGAAGARKTRLGQKWFDEVETGDLAHAMSFQKKLVDNGGDAKNRDRYERYAVSVPCPGWDPQRKFDLTYKWNEAAVQILGNVPAHFHDQNYISMKIRAAGHFRIWDDEVCTQNQQTGVTTCTTSAHQDVVHHAWLYHGDSAEITTNAMLGSIIGLYDHHDHMNFDANKFKGFGAHFVCGTRQEVHDLPATAQSPGDTKFKECVKQGVETNNRLKSESPGEPFYPDEVVVRMTFDPALECGGYFKSGGFPYYHLDRWRSTHESWESFRNMVSGCSGATPPPRHDQYTFGTILGAGLPDSMLEILLLDPADLVEGVVALQ